MNKAEEIYGEKIAPLVEQITQLCRDNRIPCALVFQMEERKSPGIRQKTTHEVSYVHPGQYYLSNTMEAISNIIEIQKGCQEYEQS